MRPFFVIIGTQNDKSASLSLARSAFNIEIEHKHHINDYYDDFFGRGLGPSINGSLLNIKAEARAEDFSHVEARCYVEAWEKMLDLWVPPDCADRTRSQILTHFTFNEV
jgi:hypothetical protein